MLAYVGLIFFLRVSGKRTLSQFNAFDLTVTIALGSMLSATILDRNLPLLQGLTGIGVLILLQTALAWLTNRFSWANWLVKSEPTPLVTDGVIDHAALNKVNISEDEVRAAMRQAHVGGPDAGLTVTLETNGTLSVIYPCQRVR